MWDRRGVSVGNSWSLRTVPHFSTFTVQDHQNSSETRRERRDISESTVSGDIGGVAREGGREAGGTFDYRISTTPTGGF